MRKYRRQVVMLIDEYDKPILNVIENKRNSRRDMKNIKDFLFSIKGIERVFKVCINNGGIKICKSISFY